MNVVHENTVLKLASIIFLGQFKNVVELGDLLLKEVGEKTDGGYWIWDLKNPEYEYYSPKIRDSLGYEDEKDFPNLSSSWQEIIEEDDKIRAFKNLKDNFSGTGSYYQIVTYNLKKGGKVKLLCSGSLMRDLKGEPLYLFGTHKLNF